MPTPAKANSLSTAVDVVQAPSNKTPRTLRKRNLDKETNSSIDYASALEEDQLYRMRDAEKQKKYRERLKNKREQDAATLVELAEKNRALEKALQDTSHGLKEEMAKSLHLQSQNYTLSNMLKAANERIAQYDFMYHGVSPNQNSLCLPPNANRTHAEQKLCEISSELQNDENIQNSGQPQPVQLCPTDESCELDIASIESFQVNEQMQYMASEALLEMTQSPQLYRSPRKLPRLQRSASRDSHNAAQINEDDQQSPSALGLATVPLLSTETHSPVCKRSIFLPENV